jgi:hypothetical protein
MGHAQAARPALAAGTGASAAPTRVHEELGLNGGRRSCAARLARSASLGARLREPCALGIGAVRVEYSHAPWMHAPAIGGGQSLEILKARRNGPLAANVRPISSGARGASAKLEVHAAASRGDRTHAPHSPADGPERPTSNAECGRARVD